MTLRELLQGKQLPVKVRCLAWEENYFFDVIDFRGTCAIGYFNGVGANTVGLDGLEFEIYTEPKKKVKKWLWAYPEHNILAVTAGFMSDDEAVKYFDRSTKYIRTNIEIEVEE